MTGTRRREPAGEYPVQCLRAGCSAVRLKGRRGPVGKLPEAGCPVAEREKFLRCANKADEELQKREITSIFAPFRVRNGTFAEIAQSVEHQLPKLRVAGSNPVFRS